MKRIASFLVVASALFLTSVRAHAANPICEGLFDSYSAPEVILRPLWHEPTSVAQLANRYDNPFGNARIDLFYSHRVTLKPDGSFDVSGWSRRNQDVRRMFNSKPTVLKRLNPLRHRYSNSGVTYDVRKNLPQLVQTDAHRHFLLHGQGDLTRLDVWSVPFTKRPKHIDVHEALFDYPREGSKSIGYLVDRSKPGVYADSDRHSNMLNIGRTAFLTPALEDGIIFAMYEVLSNWPALEMDHPRAAAPYDDQRFILMKLDLKSATATRIGEYRGPSLTATVENGRQILTEADRPETVRLTITKDRMLRLTAESKTHAPKLLLELPAR